MKLDNRQQILAIGAAALVGLFLLDKVLITPMTISWKERALAIAELQKQIKQGSETLVGEAKVRGKWEQMRTNTLPTEVSQAEQEVVKAFYEWAQDSQASVTSIKPQMKRGQTDDYSLLECRVDASGTLSTLSRFLYEVEHSPMALKIESIDISARDNGGQQLTLALLVTGLRLAPAEGK